MEYIKRINYMRHVSIIKQSLLLHYIPPDIFK